MRLDHLLSKEHLLVLSRAGQDPTSRPIVSGWGSWMEHRHAPAAQCCGLSSTPCKGWNGCCSRMGLSAGTLLGPEGSDVSSTFQTVEPPTRVHLRIRHGCGGVWWWARLRTISSHQTADSVGRCGVWGWVRPSFENCTVDASIFDICGQVFKSTWWMPWQ